MSSYVRHTLEQEIELGRRKQAGDAEARRELIENNVGLVRHIVSNMARSANRDRFNELVQAGIEGLIIAVDRYDPERGLRLNTYAVRWIRVHIMDAINSGRTIVKLRLHDTLMKYIGNIEDRAKAGESFESIADSLPPDHRGTYASADRIRATLYASRGYSSIHGIEHTMAANDTPESLVADADYRAKREYALNKSLDILDLREREVMEMRLEGMKLEDIGKVIGKCRERARQLEASAVKKMSRYCTEYLEAS